jgi:predicted benzoate:H+ symporter BenE
MQQSGHERQSGVATDARQSSAPFAALPRELVVTLAGLALLGPIMANLAAVNAADDHREAAFWGVLIGMVAYWILHARRTKAQDRQG